MAIIDRFRFLVLWIDKKFRVLIPISFLLGILLNEYELLLFSSTIFILSLCILYSNLKFLLLPVVIFLGMQRFQHFEQIEANHISNFLGQQGRIVAEISEYPYVKGMESVLTLKPILFENQEESIYISRGFLRLNTSKFLKYNKGDILDLEGNIAEPPSFVDFDYKEYLKTENIYGIIENPKILGNNSNKSVYTNFINGARVLVITKVQQQFPEPHAKLLAGMLIGTREEFSKRFSNALSVSGTSHVVAVSGYNIALIITSVVGFSGWINRRYLLYLSYLIVFVFLGIVGFDNLPALRAGLMGFVSITALLLGRKSEGIFVLFMIAAVMCFMNPYIYKSISFQLSFAATLGLMTMSDNLINLVQNFLPKTISEEAGTTITAIFVTLPITFANFGVFGSYSILANILISPFVSLISLMGIVWVFVSEIFPWFAIILEFLIWGSLEIMVKVIDWTVSLPFSSYSYQGDTKKIAVIIILLIGIFMFESAFKNHKYRNA